MQSLTLYSSPLCPYAHRARIMIAHKGLSAQIIQIDLSNKPADFLAISPHGKVPVLRHGERSVWESAVICEYLEDAFPQQPLLPSDAFERARARMWIRFADARLYAHTDQMLHSLDPQVHARCLAAIQEDLLFIEKHAFNGGDAAGPYWTGQNFSLTDATFFPWFEQLPAVQTFFDLPWPAQCTRLAAWVDAVAAYPSVVAAAKPAEFYINAYTAIARERSVKAA